jgi:outer membrane protein insertion porin family
VRTSSKDGKLESIDYNVAGVGIHIHHAEFPGASPSELPLLQAAAEKLLDREYSRVYITSFVEHTVLPIYREHGYLKAACATPQPKVVTAATSESSETKPGITLVDVIFPVTPGLQYKLSRWEWSGNKEISTSELQPLIHLKAGQTANIVELEKELRAVQELYGSRGYILASVKVAAEFDDVDATVAYQLNVTEDSLFRMGELEFRGIDNNLTARLRAAWKLRPGDVYDSSYLKEFLPQARKLLPASLDWEVSTHVTALARDKTVDVDLQYTAKAPQ